MLRAADYRARARASLRGNWWMSIGVCMVAMLLGGIGAGSTVTLAVIGETNETGGYENLHLGVEILGTIVDPAVLSAEMLRELMWIVGIALVVALAQFIIGAAVELGVCAYFSKRALGLDADMKDEMFYFQYFWKAFGLRLLTTLLIFLWSMLFVIPGIVASYRYSMASYIMAEHPQMGIREALWASSNLMDGNKWAEFCLEISFLGWALLSALTLGIGTLFLEPYMQMAKAHFYMNLSRGNGSGGR